MRPRLLRYTVMTNAAKQYPPVVIVDENDNETGSAMLTEAWRKGLYHRVVLIFVVDDRGRMLLQLRGPGVGIDPNRWDQAAGGHVDEGFSYDQAAALEVAEELGLHDASLTLLGTLRSTGQYNDRTVNRFERAYLVRVPHDAVLKHQEDEISKLQWFTPAELSALTANHPEDCRIGMLHALQAYFPEFVANSSYSERPNVTGSPPTKRI